MTSVFDEAIFGDDQQFDISFLEAIKLVFNSIIRESVVFTSRIKESLNFSSRIKEVEDVRI